MKLRIKNMVCNRCRIVVEQILDELNLTAARVELGAVTFNDKIPPSQLEQFKSLLLPTGLELLDDAKSQMLENLKQHCFNYLDNQIFLQNIKLSQYLASQFNKDYSSISRFFSSVESVSIEQYYLTIRVEKVKELIIYDELAFGEIAFDLGFSSIAHLSKQFKKLTGLTLSEFRNNSSHHQRKPRDNVKII